MFKRSDFINQNSSPNIFKNSGSWVLMSSLEKEIKDKIEQMGVPLKDWDMQINYGIKTGFNEAFIIDGNKRKELLEKDPKSAEIIRPILRGRDIKKFDHDFADLFIITTFPSLKLNIDDFPAVKEHLLSFGHDRLRQTGDTGARKKTNNKWFETQDSITYWDDFYKQKIVWGNLNLQASYTIADEGVFINAPSSIIVPANKYILAILNSKLGDYYIRNLGVTRNGGYFEYKPMFIEKLPVPKISIKDQVIFEDLIDKVLTLKKNNMPVDQIEDDLEKLIFKLYNLNDVEISLIKNKSYYSSI